MADIKLTASHDIDFNNFILTESALNSIGQKVKIRLLRYLGEYFMDTSKGVPYYQEILKKGISKDYVDVIFIDEILNTPDIVSVDEYESTLDNSSGKYSASFAATTSANETFIFNFLPITLF
jgi:hypothetical protein